MMFWAKVRIQTSHRSYLWYELLATQMELMAKMGGVSWVRQRQW